MPIVPYDPHRHGSVPDELYGAGSLWRHPMEPTSYRVCGTDPGRCRMRLYPVYCAPLVEENNCGAGLKDCVAMLAV